MIEKFYLDIPENILNYTKSLNKGEIARYYPSKSGLTNYGERIELGFSCYALKIYFMTGEWKKLSNLEKNHWIEFINSFQTISNRFPTGSYVDPQLLKSLTNRSLSSRIKDTLKTTLDILNIKNFDNNFDKINKSINAETKQAISTLSEIGAKSKIEVPFPYSSQDELNEYLINLNWNTPWSSGAQFSSLCVYSKLNDGLFDNFLYNFSSGINNSYTGSYHNEEVKSNREVINGAMKIISGLEWLDLPIHRPKNLIDFCLQNVPILEGCDIVDFVYVLHKCSNQINYKKKQINQVFTSILKDLKQLYVEKDKAFSYFINNSQTHYYGSKINSGSNSADLHGSLLCLWAILMILENLELKNEKHKIIKP